MGASVKISPQGPGRPRANNLLGRWRTRLVDRGRPRANVDAVLSPCRCRGGEPTPPSPGPGPSAAMHPDPRVEADPDADHHAAGRPPGGLHRTDEGLFFYPSDSPSGDATRERWGFAAGRRPHRRTRPSGRPEGLRRSSRRFSPAINRGPGRGSAPETGIRRPPLGIRLEIENPFHGAPPPDPERRELLTEGSPSS